MRAGAVLALVAAAGCLDWDSLTRARCGNGRVEAGEQCDDGNQVDTDGCLPGCRFAACGDGKVRAGVEECDDGNQQGGDACGPRCLACAGGDGRFTWESGVCYVRFDERSSWEAAATTCKEAGGHPVAHNAFVEMDAVTRTLLAGVGPTWLGLHDEAGIASYGWITGEPFGATTLVRWPPVMPVPTGQCGAQEGPMDWSLRPCSTTLSFVCEHPGWTLRPRDNHAYRALYRELSFDGAVALCQRTGGHLVTISDAEENEFLANQFFGSFWIGATRTAAGGDFTWITAEPFSYQPYAPGEPDRTQLPNCLVLGDDHLWHDRECATASRYYGAICEID